jgi:hypothetical protein
MLTRPENGETSSGKQLRGSAVWRLADIGVVDDASLIAANECADYVGRERLRRPGRSTLCQELSIRRKHPVGYFSRQSECAAGPRNRAFRAAHPACAGCRMR